MTRAEDGAGRWTRAVLAGLIAALVFAGMLHAREAGAAEDDTELKRFRRAVILSPRERLGAR